MKLSHILLQEDYREEDGLAIDRIIHMINSTLYLYYLKVQFFGI